MNTQIELNGVKQNNLKDIDVKLPLGTLTVVCGPSGSGKSSLAFETLYAEGQRRFIESLSNYTKQFLNKAPKPDVDEVVNIPPSIAIEQKNSVKGSRSTVGTQTEVIDYIRLLFEKLGQSHCPDHGVPTERMSVTHGAARVVQELNGQRGYLLAEIGEKTRLLEGKKLHSFLLQEGFLRIYVPKTVRKKKAKKVKVTKKKKTASPKLQKEEMGEVLEISGPAAIKKGLPKKTFYLVIDRLGFSASSQDRVADSLGQAYEAFYKLNAVAASRQALVLTTEGDKIRLSEDEACSICGYTPPPVTSALFSFNSPVGACPSCKGFGNILDLDEKKVIPNPRYSIDQGAIHPFEMPSAKSDRRELLKYCKAAKIDIKKPWEDLHPPQREAIWEGNEKFYGVRGLFDYLEQKKYKMHVRVFLARYKGAFECPTCHGSRLRPEAEHVLMKKHSIGEITRLTIGELHELFEKMKFTTHEKEIASEVVEQIRSRLQFLVDVGVHYLTLERETKTLSGGEFQRINLAKQLGTGLSQTLYVLDEPTIGLHPRDNDRLIDILKQLRDLENTVVVVEHDQEVIQASDHIVEMGPGSGYKGGEIIFEGDIPSFYSSEVSQTAQYIKPGRTWTPMSEPRPVEIKNYRYKVELKGAKGNNLKNVNIAVPMNRLVAVTGVSGSGKSTLITQTLYPAVAQALNIENKPGEDFRSLKGLEHIKNVLLIDQSPVGKSARSNPVTYLKIYDAIRNIMATTAEAKERGYTPGTFSLNVDGGRCPVCKGMGFEEIDMMFMDNILIPCDTCDGKKFRPEVLEIKYKRKNIHEILSLTVEEAMSFFVAYPNIRRPLSILKEVGLEYLQIGQASNTLSGGESQRLKMARELGLSHKKATLYILDEPTTGLHFREISLLMKVLNRLVEAGNSVLVIEHNLDVIKDCDYVIDMGPEAGEHGGQIVFEGSPEAMMKSRKSLTGQYLKRHVKGV